jgi:hypothetical protein
VPTFDHLTTSATRAQAAAAVDDLLGVDQGAPLLVADLLDAISAGACRAAGLTDVEARTVLGILWDQR